VCLAKVRRLYDIANVLTALRLIEKIHLVQSRKAAFKWLGSDVFPLTSSVPDNEYVKDGDSRPQPTRRRFPGGSFIDGGSWM